MRHRIRSYRALPTDPDVNPIPVILPEYALPVDEWGVRPRFRQGRIYFLRQKRNCRGRLVKIGFTENLDQRMKQLAPIFGTDLMGSIPGTKQTETKIHRAFHHRRYALELFWLVGDLEHAIAQTLALGGDA